MPYQCTQCRQLTPKEKLTVKRVQFATLGQNYRVKRNRTVAKLCPDCLNQDEAWKQPPYQTMAL